MACIMASALPPGRFAGSVANHTTRPTRSPCWCWLIASCQKALRVHVHEYSWAAKNEPLQRRLTGQGVGAWLEKWYGMRTRQRAEAIEGVESKQNKHTTLGGGGQLCCRPFTALAQREFVLIRPNILSDSIMRACHSCKLLYQGWSRNVSICRHFTAL